VRNPPDHDDKDRQSTALMGLVICLLVLIAGIFLVQELGRRRALDDCLLSGRRYCIPVQLISLRAP